MSLITLLLGLLSKGACLKFLLSFGSIVLTIVVYAESYGWQFALGFVALIFIHEMGHYIAALPQLIKAWNFNASDEENKRYYDLKEGARFEYTVMYLLLVAVLSLMLHVQLTWLNW